MLAVLVLAASAGFEAVMPLPLAAQTLSSSSQAARRLFEIVDAQPEVVDNVESKDWGKEKTEPGIRVGTLLPALSLSDLSFTYPASRKFALQGIRLFPVPRKAHSHRRPERSRENHPGEPAAAFLGLFRGQIFMDGRDLHAPQEQVRRQFSCLSQRTWFFNDTIRHNLLLARPDAAESEIQDAAQRAQIHDFILGLPQGYETLIGERGFRLSGGTPAPGDCAPAY